MRGSGSTIDSRLRRWLPLLVVAAVLAVAGFAAGGPGVTAEIGPPPPFEEERAAQVPSPPATSPPTPPPEFGSVEDFVYADRPGWLTWPITILFLALVVGTLGLLLYLGVRFLLTERVIRRDFSDQAASQPDRGVETEEIRDALRAGLADIDAGGDPRRAVIACWLRLERAAAAAGTARLAADTPADLVTRLLAGHRVSDQALSQLAEAYRQARYAPAAIGPELLATAERALRDVDAQLSRRHPGSVR